MSIETKDRKGDPQTYMSAERTFLAWIRTAISLMVFGFVISRFGFFLRTIANATIAPGEDGSGFSVAIGLALIGVGILVCIIAAIRHHRYVQAIDQGQFRSAFGTKFSYGVAGLLVVVALGMAVVLTFLMGG